MVFRECLVESFGSREAFLGVAMYKCMLSHFSSVRLFATLWNVAHQAPLSIGFSRQEHWSGLPCNILDGIFQDPGVKPTSLMPLALAGSVLYQLGHLERLLKKEKIE